MAVAGVARRVLFFAVVLVVVVALPIPADTSPSVKQEIAKAPTESGLVEQKAAPAQPAPKADKPSIKPAGKTIEIAQFLDPTPAAGSAAELILQAQHAAFYVDRARQRTLLEAAVAAEPGSVDAGRALTLLAATYTKDDPNRADELFAQVEAQYTQPEVRSFAGLLRSAKGAEQAGDWDTVETLLSDAAEKWQGTYTGIYARLYLGNHYRFNVDNWDAAMALYSALRDEYQTGPVAEEAAASLAECLDWANTGRRGEAVQAYEEMLATAQTEYLRVRALVGLGDCYATMGDWTSAWDTLSLVLSTHPDDSAAPLATIIRGLTAEHLGYWEDAVEAARFYLASFAKQPAWRAYATEILAKDAFRAGRFEEAEQQFAAVAAIAENRHAADYAGRARAGIAACMKERGDLRGALAKYMEAAELSTDVTEKALYLYDAAMVAQASGDAGAVGQIANQMAAEFPGSYLTTRLVGQEILPTPEL